MMGAFFMRGTPVETSAHVLTYMDTGLRWDEPFRARTSQICIHWTGAENTPSDAFRNMSAKRYSVHFIVDQAGMAYQFADTSCFCAHASGINDRSIGIEVVNRANAAVPDKGIKRALVNELIHGQTVAYRDFLPAQVATVIALCESLCDAYEIPMVVPMRGDHVRTDVLSKPELATYRGVIGHMHTKVGKLDPGAKILRAVAARAQARKRSPPLIG